MSIVLGFPVGSVGKASACNAGDTGDAGSIPRSGRFPWKRPWQPTPVSLPEKSHGQSSPAGYSPKSCKEQDVTEHTHTHTCLIRKRGANNKVRRSVMATIDNNG